MRYPESGSFYDLLGVSHNASTADIRAAFLRLAQRHHPDLNAADSGADRRFKQIRRVYEILSDPVKRAAYDETPGRFRLSDADIVSDDSAPIVTRPLHGASDARTWAVRSRLYSADTFRPRWLSDRRFRRESRLVFAGAITAMVILSAIPVMMIRSHREALEARSRVSRELSDTQPLRPEDGRDGSELIEVISPLDQVIESVHDLRSDATTEVATLEPAVPAPHTSHDETPRPAFDIVDELNLPIPGWPIIASPPAVPISTPTPPPAAASESGYGMPPIHSHGRTSPQFDWSASPSPVVDAAPRRPLLPEPAPAEWTWSDRFTHSPQFAEAWSRLPSLHGSAISPSPDLAPPLPSVAGMSSLSGAPGTGFMQPLVATFAPPLPGGNRMMAEGRHSPLPPFPAHVTRSAAVGNIVSVQTPRAVPPVSREFQVTTAALPVSNWDHAALPLHAYSTGQQSVPEGTPPYVSASHWDARTQLHRPSALANGAAESRIGMPTGLPGNLSRWPPSAPLGPTWPRQAR